MMYLGLLLFFFGASLLDKCLPQISTPQLPATVEVQSQPIEIEILLLRFDNPQGIVYSGEKCDFFAWGCDTWVAAYIDIEQPYDDFPGYRDIQKGDFVYYHREDSSPHFNHFFRKTVCNSSSFKAANLRVHMKDIDSGFRGSADLINNFNCITPKSSDLPANENFAGWSEDVLCDPVYSNPLMSLYFRYREFRNANASSCSFGK